MQRETYTRKDRRTQEIIERWICECGASNGMGTNRCITCKTSRHVYMKERNQYGRWIG